MKYEILNLDYADIKVKYPKAVNKIKEWFKGREDFKSFLLQIGANFDEDAVLENFVGLNIQYNPRLLYDFLDDIGIYIGIDCLERDEFVYNIVAEDEENGFGAIFENMKPSRIEAEKTAFLESLSLFEEKLK